MFSNKKSIQNIENELFDNGLIINKSDFPDKFEGGKTENFCSSNEGAADSIYEFTFDPDEETPPPSKQVAPRKKAKPKPKVIFVNNNYETNVLKTLQTLKNSIKRNSLDANNKENEFNESPEPVQQHNAVGNISPELKNTSTSANKKKIKKESPPRRDGLLKDILSENTPTVTASKHPKASPWRANFKEIPLAHYNHTNLKESPKPATKSKIAFSFQDTNSSVVENIEPKLKQPRLIDFIKQSSDRTSNNAEMVSKDQEITDEKVKNQGTDGSLHLFDELEVIHSVKPCRRSYGKKEILSPTLADKAHGSDKQFLDLYEELSAINTCNKKAELKQAKKNEQKTQLTRQEEEEVNAWAEAFNSMCEDVDDFPLVVE